MIYFRVSPRGAGYLFGSDVVKNFCDTNGIEMICRAHQLVSFCLHSLLIFIIFLR